MKIETSNGAWSKGEVYFLSHGVGIAQAGPPTMFDTESGAYKAWKTYGKAVLEAKPRGLIVVSAHWENGEDSPDVIVNVDTSNPLIYDFYNFPKHFYTQTFESKGDQRVVEDVKRALGESGIKVKEERRGLDHGIWVPFKVAFEGKTDIPIVQVSLPGDGSPVSSARLGKGLASLRELGYGIMGTGQVVHNLRDLFGGRPTPYTEPYMEAVKTALESSKPLESTLTLFRHPLYKSAHPTPEHLLPLAVAVGAVDEGDRLEEIYVSSENLGWGMWRWRV